MDGSLDVMAVHEPAGEWLTTWSVSPDGRRARFGFADAVGRPRRLDLPVEAVGALLMTLPRVLQVALDRLGDGTARMVQPLGLWHLEQGIDPGQLTLSTPDGFSVAFALAPAELAAMAEAGQAHRPGTSLSAPVLN